MCCHVQWWSLWKAPTRSPGFVWKYGTPKYLMVHHQCLINLRRHVVCNPYVQSTFGGFLTWEYLRIMLKPMVTLGSPVTSDTSICLRTNHQKFNGHGKPCLTQQLQQGLYALHPLLGLHCLQLFGTEPWVCSWHIVDGVSCLSETFCYHSGTTNEAGWDHMGDRMIWMIVKKIEK